MMNLRDLFLNFQNFPSSLAAKVHSVFVEWIVRAGSPSFAFP